MKKRRRTMRQRGQALVEYVIIVVVVALAAFAIVAAFSDRVRAMFSGATEALGGTPSVEANTSSLEVAKSIGQDFNQ